MFMEKGICLTIYCNDHWDLVCIVILVWKQKIFSKALTDGLRVEMGWKGKNGVRKGYEKKVI